MPEKAKIFSSGDQQTSILSSGITGDYLSEGSVNLSKLDREILEKHLLADTNYQIFIPQPIRLEDTVASSDSLIMLDTMSAGCIAIPTPISASYYFSQRNSILQ